MLLIAVVREGRTEIVLGFRFYQDPKEENELTDPLEIFTKLLERYGLPVTVGTQTGLLIPSAVVEEATSQSRTNLVHVHAEPDEEFIVNTLFRIRAGSPRVADVAWAFAISSRRYHEDIRKRRRPPKKDLP
jgi:hypothetical protein